MTTDSNADASDASTSIGAPMAIAAVTSTEPARSRANSSSRRATPSACASKLAEVAIADRAPLVVDDDQQHDAGADAPRPLESAHETAARLASEPSIPTRIRLGILDHPHDSAGGRRTGNE